MKLNLTPAGHHLYEEYRKTVEHRLSHTFSRLTEKQQRRLLLALNDLEQVLDTPRDYDLGQALDTPHNKEKRA